MASRFDLEPRIERGLAQRGLHVEGVYRPAPLPMWLYGPWQEAQRNAGDKLPALMLNCKGTQIDDCVVMVRLADLEQLTEGEQVDGTQRPTA